MAKWSMDEYARTDPSGKPSLTQSPIGTVRQYLPGIYFYSADSPVNSGVVELSSLDVILSGDNQKPVNHPHQ